MTDRPVREPAAFHHFVGWNNPAMTRWTAIARGMRQQGFEMCVNCGATRKACSRRNAPCPATSDLLRLRRRGRFANAC